MLDPSARSLYTTALSPPPGYVFDQALATTFSLDLTTLLSIPLHLLMLSPDWRESEQLGPIATLEGLRRVAGRISVYCQSGRIALPASPHVLYGLLEPVVVQVRAPNKNGVFHPKVWVLRYLDSQDRRVLIRVLVLSRNLSADDSWDVVLSVDGAPGKIRVAENEALAMLVRALPTTQLALSKVPSGAKARARLLADELSRCSWALPSGFQSLAFRCLGLSNDAWLPPKSRRLAVISPFCGEQAISALAKRTDVPVALVSRPEELAKLPQSALDKFGQVLIMDDAVETDRVDDGGEERRERQRGLHAKVYVAEHGWDTTIAVGSANMTQAGLFGTNVELMAELTGRRSVVEGIDELLAPGGLRDILVPYQAGESSAPSDEEVAAERALEAARRTLAGAKLSIRCESAGEGWQMFLSSNTRLKIEGIDRIVAWPVSLDESSAVDISGVSATQEVLLACCQVAAVTGFVAFSLSARAFPAQLQFVLSLPVLGLPEERDAAITRALVNSEEAFLRYLRLLLAGDPDGQATGEMGGTGFVWSTLGSLDLDESSLLEDLTRSLSLNPAGLKQIDTLVRQITAGPDGARVIPAEFHDLWKAFEPLVDES